MTELKWKVRNLYKKLLHIGKEHPNGYTEFRRKLKEAFKQNSHMTDKVDIKIAIRHGEYFYKELEAMWFLRK